MSYNSNLTGAQVQAKLDAIDGKQDKIDDLATIRSGASKGATALQSHQEIKTINGASIIGSGNYDTHYPVVTISSASQELQPNTYYKFNGGSLSVTLAAASANMSEYVLEVTMTGSLTLPSSIVWANEDVPTFEAGKTYVISIVNNLAVYAVFV